MATNDRCSRCGAMLLPEEKFCPQCGAPQTEAAAQADVAQAAPGSGWQPGQTPATIDQLRDFCDFNQMPLDKMRFFVGVNYRQPRAFGIYRDGDNFVVYKNKDNGSRAVRYHGPDEACAVNELYQKLLEECHKRNIWPDGKPAEGSAAPQRKRERKRDLLLALIVALIMALALVVFSFLVLRTEIKKHGHDGYYRFDDDGIYYRYGSTWYYDDDTYDWIAYHDIGYADEYADYYLGDDYDDAWGYSNFEDSSAWESIQESSHSSSDDYDSWDSGDTDWSSDW